MQSKGVARAAYGVYVGYVGCGWSSSSEAADTTNKYRRGEGLGAWGKGSVAGLACCGGDAGDWVENVGWRVVWRLCLCLCFTLVRML